MTDLSIALIGSSGEHGLVLAEDLRGSWQAIKCVCLPFY